MNAHNIADFDQRLHIGMEGKPQLFLRVNGKSVTVRVVQCYVKGLQALQHRQANTPATYYTNAHSLNIVGTGYSVRYIPTALHNQVVLTNVVPDEGKYLHNRVFRNADAIAISDFTNSYVPIDRRPQINVVRTDSGSNCQPQVGGFRYPVRSKVSGPERLRYYHVSIDNFLFEGRIVTIFIGGNNQPVTTALDEFSQSQAA